MAPESSEPSSTIRTLKYRSTAHTINTTTPRNTRAHGLRSRIVAAGISLSAAIFALYLVEAALTFVNPYLLDKVGTTLRRGASVIGETVRLRHSGIAAVPFLQPDTFVDSTGRSSIAIAGKSLVPLSGLPNALTILCNESGTTVGYRADSLGFRNPQDVWGPIQSRVVLIGDSFTHGFCRTESETIAGRLRASSLPVLNLGLTGAGPLAELGVLREFGLRRKPAQVYWLFYEGNDLIDLSSEGKTILRNYVDANFSQHLFDNRADIAMAITRFSDSLLSTYRPPTTAQKIGAFLILRKLRTATGLYRQPAVPQGNEQKELLLLEQVLARAARDVKAAGGNLTLVYLPERRRFNPHSRAVAGENHDPRLVQQRVTEIARRAGIPMIDVANIFAAQKDPRSLWNARRYHYNAIGYSLIADAIRADVEKNQPLRSRM